MVLSKTRVANNFAIGAIAMIVSSCAACAQPPAPAAPPPAAAARVQNAAPEAALATITLKPEAEAHLALETAEVRMETAPRTRTVGGEAMARPGERVVVSAPVAGTVVAAAGRAPGIGRVHRGAVLFELIPLSLETTSRLPVGAHGELGIASPLAGTVTALHAAPGQTVAAGAPLFDVVATDVLWIRVPLYAGELALVDTEAQASVATLGQAAAWQTAVPVAGPPSANAAAASADLYFELPNPAGAIRPGERLTVQLTLSGATRALVVPRSAVIYDLTGGAWVYEVKAPHVYARRRIEIAGVSGPRATVSRGLAEGVRIVTVGAAELYGAEFFVSK